MPRVNGPFSPADGTQLPEKRANPGDGCTKFGQPGCLSEIAGRESEAIEEMVDLYVGGGNVSGELTQRSAIQIRAVGGAGGRDVLG